VIVQLIRQWLSRSSPSARCRKTNPCCIGVSGATSESGSTTRTALVSNQAASSAMVVPPSSRDTGIVRSNRVLSLPHNRIASSDDTPSAVNGVSRSTPPMPSSSATVSSVGVANVPGDTEGRAASSARVSSFPLADNGKLGSSTTRSGAACAGMRRDSASATSPGTPDGT
jgi:hypothetical protein